MKSKILLMSLLPILLFVGCEKYGFSPIVGSWRLLTYTNSDGYSTPVPSVENTYCLCFEGDGSFRGNGYLNTFWGKFSLEKKGITIDIDKMTQLVEYSYNMQAERDFVDALNRVDYYSVSGGHLTLGYSDKKMIFRRESVLIPTN